MISQLSLNWEFEGCVGYLVSSFSGSEGGKAKVYVSSLTPKMSRSGNAGSVSLPSPNQIFINESSTMPRPASRLIRQNYVEVPVVNEMILKQSVEDIYKRYLATLPHPPHLTHIPISVTINSGTKVSVNSDDGSLRSLYITTP